MAGDSTMAQNSLATKQGWGTPFAEYMNVTVVNLARGGRSARSYTREGLFASLVAQITPGDYVIIEFGHNDGGNPSTYDTASVYGSDNSTKTVTLSDGTVEVVQTFVTYEKNMANDVLAAGGVPILSSQTPNGDSWNDAKTEISYPPRFVGYAEIAASQTGSVFMNHWSWVAIAYGHLGYDNVYPKLFPGDHTHTNPEGADVVARAFVNGLRCTNHPLAGMLTAAGEEIPMVCS